MMARGSQVASGAVVDSAFGRLVEGLTARLQAGEPVDWSALAREHPDHADELSAIRPTLEALGRLSRAGESAVSGVAPTADDDLLPGVLGDFRIVREIGRGGMGVVYQSEQISLNRNVALKVLPFAATMDPRQLQRFRHEAQAAAILHHPNIVPVHGVGCERGVHFYAMQLIQGRSLAAVIEELRGGLDIFFQRPPHPSGEAGPKVPPPASVPTNSWSKLDFEAAAEPSGENQAMQMDDMATLKQPPLPASPRRGQTSRTAPIAALSTLKTHRDRAHFRHIAELIAHTADALEYAHSMGVVHRDIKPANLLLDEAGHLWVTDFGLARFGSDADLTMTGDLLGTLRYMSPEQALARHGLVDHRTDIYSLGATLYELLTLRPAMEGADKQEILKKIAFEEPQPPRLVARTIPEELETITLKALAKEPADRYATAGDLAEDLRRWLGNQTIKAKPPTVRQRLVKWGRRHPSLVGATGVVLLLAVAGLTVNTALIHQEKKRTQAALDLAYQMAKQSLFDIADAVADTPGLEEIQRKVVLSAVSTFEGLANYQGTGPEFERDRGLAQFRLGMIHDRMGDLRKGRDAYTQAADIFRRLSDAEVNNADYRYWYAHSLAEHGDLCDRLGDGKDAEDLARQAYLLFQKAEKDFPDNNRIRAGLADCCLVLGSVNFFPGPRMNFEFQPDSSPQRWEESIGLLGQAVTLYPTVIENAPEHIEYRWRFYRAQKVLSQMPKLSFAKREQLVNDSVAGFEALVSAYQRKHRPRAELCEALVWRGVLLRDGGRGLAQAEPKFRRAGRIADKLVEEYPDVPYYCTLQAGTRFALGSLLAAAGRPDEAERLLKLAAEYVDGTPDGHVPPWQLACQAARSNQFLGIIYDHAGRLDDAEKAYRQAIKLDSRVVRAYPIWSLCKKVQWNRDRLASVLSRRGSTADGIEVHRAHTEFWKRQATLQPSNPSVLRAHGWSLNGLGYYRQTLGLWEEADEAYGEALDAYDKLEKSGLLNPGSGEYWRGVDSWKQQQMQRAWLYAKAGRPGDAEKAVREFVLRADRDLEAASPGTPAQRKEIRIAMGDLGKFLNTIGRQHESISAYQNAIRQLDQWRIDFPSEPHAEYASNFRMALALVHQSVGRAAEANRAADEAITIERKLAASAKLWPRRWLARHLGNQGLIRLRAGRVEDAGSSRGEAVEIMASLVADPAQGDAKLLVDDTSRYAHLLEHTGRFVEAQAAFEKTVELRRRLAEAVEPGDLYGADLHLNMHIGTRNDWADSLNEFASFHLRRGQSEQAAKDCDQARAVLEQTVTEYPAEPSTLNRLAWFLVTCPVETVRDPAEAVRLARIAVAWYETSARLGTLGAAQFRAGDHRAAVANLERSMRLEDKQPSAGYQFFLAMAHGKIGNTEAARRYYYEAVRQEELPDSDGADLLHTLREEAVSLLGVK
jgi:serine/threonine protein kinase/Flp pilus assembly protein TadD